MHEVLLANTKLYERKLELINEEIYDFIENYTYIFNTSKGNTA
jgi:hypothetical protein